MKNRIKGDWNEVKGMLKQIFAEAEGKSNETNEESKEKKSEQYNKPINPNF